MVGKEILEKKLERRELNQFPLKFTERYYIVRVQTDSTVKTAKVYIQ
jgi:hypothetical protein